MTFCTSCGAEIHWVKMPSGKLMPVDATPAPTGTIDVYNGTGEVLTGEDLDAARTAGEELHVPHWATCPTADRHRSRK